jgi:hypothetical protein
MRLIGFIALLSVSPYLLGCGASSHARSKLAVADTEKEEKDELENDTPPAGEPGGGAGTKIESPLYTSWSRFPVGSTATFREVTAAGTNQTVTTITYKLLELTKSQVVVEFTAFTKHYDGHETSNPPEKLTNPRLVSLPPGKTKLEFGKPEGLLDEGEETLQALGKEYKTKSYYAKGRTDGGDTFTRTWTSDEVPGGLLKSVYKVPARGSTSTLELIAIKTP